VQLVEMFQQQALACEQLGSPLYADLLLLLRLGWEAFEQVLRARGPELRVLLSQPPQTNEVGRASALYGGLLRLAESVPLPVRLFEIGSSAGLNLRADHFRYNLEDGTGFGPADSPVQLDQAWSGRPMKPVPAPRIVERTGSDPAPVNPLNDEGALTLASYVWPDMTGRLERLRGALEVARRVPADCDGKTRCRSSRPSNRPRDTSPSSGTP
jgi:hypothetical protein